MKLSFSDSVVACLLALLLCTGVNAQDNLYCGNPFVNPKGWGPFDYLDPMEHANPRHIPMLEKHHFGPDVRAGRHYNTLNDLDFLLRACPNHHPALNVLLQYHLKKRPSVPPQDSAACYLDRAVRFNPEDGTVRLLAGIYYARSGDDDQALANYREGLKLLPESVDLHYNIGLLYAKLGQLSEANEHAVRAYTLGAQLPGLKRKLIRLNAWNPEAAEPQTANPAADSDEDRS